MIHGVNGTPGVEVFDTPGPLPVARYIRACLKLPEHTSDVSTDSAAGDSSGDESDACMQEDRFVERAMRTQQQRSLAAAHGQVGLGQ